MNRTYGFEGEAKHKHGEQTYKVKVLLPTLMHTKLNINCSSSRTYSRLVRDTLSRSLKGIDVPFSAPCFPCICNETTIRVFECNSVTRRQEAVLCRAWWTVQQGQRNPKRYSQARAYRASTGTGGSYVYVILFTCGWEVFMPSISRRGMIVPTYTNDLLLAPYFCFAASLD